ncbi:hypothetical protein [Pseudomonas syringae]|uniref:hypothetical protein n=1 Tax=Pseudomonas syringae TaxID=317 RepID=UPI00245A4F3D|nr:hypothetical protein [Pseudomonas syringae]MDH4602309.1 hypothetical protein [Pseudomonas syringae pv. papulans]
MQDLRERIEQLQEEEQEGFDNLPEGLQQGERGQAMEQAAEQMGTALDSIDEAVQAREEAQA